jgi:hypothetical protein
MSPSYENSVWPSTLYHVKRTIIDLAEDPSGSTQTTDVLGTFTQLDAAKKAANAALASEGYVADDFETLAVKSEQPADGSWGYGGDVLVYAKAPRGQKFEVRLDVKENEEKFIGDEEGKVVDYLHYGMPNSLSSQLVVI